MCRHLLSHRAKFQLCSSFVLPTFNFPGLNITIFFFVVFQSEFSFLADIITGNIIKYDVIRLMQEFLRKAAINCGLNPGLVSVPVAVS